jgi:hypothetical protein
MLLGMGRPDTREALIALAEEVYDLVEGRIFENLIRVMLMRQYPSAFRNGIKPQMEFLIHEAWANRRLEDNAVIRHTFGTKAALVGIGAPTHVFLPAVAQALGAGCILPEHAEVANAIGALKASIDVSVRVDISQRLSADFGNYYIAHTPGGSCRFKDLDAAVDAATGAAEEAALKEARSRGAVGELTAVTRVEKQGAVSKWGTDVSLGCTVISEVTIRR